MYLLCLWTTETCKVYLLWLWSTGTFKVHAFDWKLSTLAITPYGSHVVSTTTSGIYFISSAYGQSPNPYSYQTIPKQIIGKEFLELMIHDLFDKNRIGGCLKYIITYLQQVRPFLLCDITRTYCWILVWCLEQVDLIARSLYKKTESVTYYKKRQIRRQ